MAVAAGTGDLHFSLPASNVQSEAPPTALPTVLPTAEVVATAIPLWPGQEREALRQQAAERALDARARQVLQERHRIGQAPLIPVVPAEPPPVSVPARAGPPTRPSQPSFVVDVPQPHGLFVAPTLLALMIVLALLLAISREAWLGLRLLARFPRPRWRWLTLSWLVFEPWPAAPGVEDEAAAGENPVPACVTPSSYRPAPY